MRINTNVSSLEAQRALSEHQKSVENSSGKLAQGTRVRSAADDAASLAIGTKHQTNIRSQHQALRNANDAVSHLQIAEGSMNEISSMLVRLKELSIQAANDHLQHSDRQLLNVEYMALRSEIERNIRSTTVNGKDILRPKHGSQVYEFQIGNNHDSASRLSMDQSEIALSEFNMTLVDSNVVSAHEARLNLGYIDKAIAKVSRNRAYIGSLQGRLQSTINNLDTSNVNESEAYSQRMDTDYAAETSDKIRAEGKLKAASSILKQTHSFSAMALKLLKD